MRDLTTTSTRHFDTWDVMCAFHQIMFPVRPTKKNGKRALSRAIANRDAPRR